MPPKNEKGGTATVTARDLNALNHTKLAFSMREVGELLGVSERSVWTLCKEGKIQSFRIGRSVRISLDALQAFIANGGSE